MLANNSIIPQLVNYLLKRALESETKPKVAAKKGIVPNGEGYHGLVIFLVSAPTSHAT